jgi:heat shock protein HtpX
VSVPSSAPPVLRPAGLKSTDFLAAQRQNRRRTMVLMLVLALIAGGLGLLVGAVLGYDERAAPDLVAALTGPTAILGAAALALASLLWSWGTLFFGGRMVAGLTGADEVSRDAEPQLHNIVEEMAIAAGVPKPKVLVIETEVPNAFATGMRTDKAAIGVTRGLLQRMSRAELQAVIGHEMGHVANLDTRYMTAVTVTVGLIALVSDVALRSLQWGSFGRSRSRDDRKGGGAQAILVVVLIVFAILAPLAAKLVQFAVSRQREYLADATSVQFTRDPEAMISALRRLTEEAKPFPGASGATQHLFIVNPLRSFTSRSMALLATHPALEDRIERLQNLGS